ncbi:replication initiator [Nonomuraea sp. NPDC059194]|uniref:replication initiator n=1 Tax=Nonomuraea sp. NPDC059194 TaxID=3346764 RepID=UPI0036800DFF
MALLYRSPSLALRQTFWPDPKGAEGEGDNLLRSKWPDQRRGVVHPHTVIRIDGPDGPEFPPPPWATEENVADVVRHAASDRPHPGRGC